MSKYYNTSNKSNKYNISKLLHNINKYMLYDNNMEFDFLNKTKNQTKNIITKQTNVNNIIIPKKKPIDKFFIVDEEDKLFWYFYVILNGIKTYEYEKNAVFKVEKDFKIASIEQLRKKKPILKEHKLRLTEIEDELLNQSKITLKGLYGLCLLHNINIMYVWDRKYVHIYTNCEDKTHIIEKHNGVDKYIIHNDTPIQDYIDKFWKIENISKPLKGFSVYSLVELVTICNKLNISCKDERNKKKTKKMLYEDIIKTL
jgi:hypothetical protein